MPAFRYESPSSPFGATIAEILAHQNDASIRASEERARLNAQAQMESARAWSGAAQNIGQLPLQVVRTMSDKRLDDAKIQALNTENAQRQVALSQARRADAGQRTLAGAMQTSIDPSMQPQGPDLSQPNGVVPQTPNFLKPEGNGVSVWDVEGLSKYMASQGYGDLNPMFVKDVNGLNDVVRNEATARQATIRHIADMSYRTGNNPAIANELVRTLEVNGFYPPETLQQIKGTIGTPAFDKIVAGLRTPTKPEILKPGEQGFDPQTNQPIPGLSVPEKPERPVEVNPGNQLVTPGGQVVYTAPPKPVDATVEALNQARLAEITKRLNAPDISPLEAAKLDLERQKLKAGLEKADTASVRVETVDENGKPVVKFLPKSEVKGQSFAKPTSAALATRLASAEAVNQTGNDIIAKLSDPATAAKLGPIMGRFNSLRDFFGNPPPEYAELAGQIESYALANMGVHGMRSAQGAAQISKMLNEKGTPESLIAKIKGLQGFSTHLLQNEGKSSAPAAPTAPAPKADPLGLFK